MALFQENILTGLSKMLIVSLMSLAVFQEGLGLEKVWSQGTSNSIFGFHLLVFFISRECYQMIPSSRSNVLACGVNLGVSCWESVSSGSSLWTLRWHG